MKLVFVFVYLFQSRDDFINLFLRHLNISEHFFDRSKQLFLANPCALAISLEVRTTVIDVAALFEFRGDRASAFFAMHQSAQGKGLGGVFYRFLVIAG
ncbi:MAG: hypothetical protein A2374_05370 [Candidatus Moranbacteria bacterium RIFOXYB1_FULL_44_23]|nr:MAG: hypothetical protein A2194_03930 [Candidatus Moranbacteria bacterium RIFOXYA1_FULL_44_8]OGI36946.1 MAG: hypothetical protein A2407_04615 [Candidatus Moranbacteria bacterium RIFOXYC1_FULL_44_8]OGI40189.1 MAG: hypothetical protein A2374_05370 [Candidatus Moranbacteria bacterium RIFOXYB1_FULL_44_23]OGI43103.1 MAG: hypothetical protein A2593_00815 [Candidatus Moranbacteria bacterium RIFOXYD1_FULL_44_9]